MHCKSGIRGGMIVCDCDSHHYNEQLDFHLDIDAKQVPDFALVKLY